MLYKSIFRKKGKTERREEGRKGSGGRKEEIS